MEFGISPNTIFNILIPHFFLLRVIISYNLSFGTAFYSNPAEALRENSYKTPAES